MPISSEALQDLLVRDNPEYRDLIEQHKRFEERLEKLNARHFLSEEEKVEATMLKKQKLALKDRMAEIAREFASQGESTRH